MKVPGLDIQFTVFLSKKRHMRLGHRENRQIQLQTYLYVNSIASNPV